MGRLILASVLLGMAAIPLMAARDPDATRGLKRALFRTAAFEAVYLVAVLFIYPRL